MRLLILLLLPAALLLGTAYLEQAVVGQSPPSAQGRPQAIVWGGRTFTHRRPLAHWLRAHGTSYELWASRHPSLATAVAGAYGAVGSTERHTAGLTSAGHERTDWATSLMGGVVALGGGSALVWALRRRRRRSVRLWRGRPRTEERSRTRHRLREARRLDLARLAPLVRTVLVGASRGTHMLGEAGKKVRDASQHALSAVGAARSRNGDLVWYLAACMLAIAVGFLLPHAL